MIESTDILITVASWEERFQAGFERLLQMCPSKIFVFFYKEYIHVTKLNLQKVQSCSQSAELKIIELSFGDPVKSWKTITETLSQPLVSGKNVVVDISTMPRESIWIIFDILDEFSASISYVYHQPTEYSREWLSRDPQKPRMVFKLSGISRLGFPTRLVVTAGYDVDRIRQMIAHFEPDLTIIGVQTGTQFGNEMMNIERHTKYFANDSRIKLFSLDAFTGDHGLKSIEDQIKDHAAESNLVMTSLGPKLSAIPLYRLHKKYPSISLAYAPSREYNPEYSKGIGNTVCGVLKEYKTK